MTKRNANQVRGRLGELDFVRELERQGLSCVDLTSQDYGLDVVAMVPETPLDEDTITSIGDRGAGNESWAMSANYISLQVKNVSKPSLTTHHLKMWNAANFRRPGSCFVVFVEDDHFSVLSPSDIESLLKEAHRSGQASINPFANDRNNWTEFLRPNDTGKLGRYLACWGHLGVLLAEVEQFNRALKEDRLLFSGEAASLLEDLLLLNHLEDDEIQATATRGASEIQAEAKQLIELLEPACSDASFMSDEAQIDKLLGDFLADNTWLDPTGKDKAFSRYNRALPRILPEELAEMIEQFPTYIGL